jgi:hypothetical protein
LLQVAQARTGKIPYRGDAMTSPIGSRISELKFEEGFTGNGKIFVHVEKQSDNSEKLVIYESNNALTAFFANLFRNRSDTFTLREWAHRKLGDLPETFDKQRLTQNIKQLASRPCVETAPQILNKLISERKLDADETSVSKSIRFLPLGKAACAIEIEASLRALQKKSMSSWVGKSNEEIARQLVKDLELDLGHDQVMLLLPMLHIKDPNTDFKDCTLTKKLLPYQDRDEKKQSWPEGELRTYVRLLTAIASKLPSANASPSKERYLASLELINQNLTSKDNASSAT